MLDRHCEDLASFMASNFLTSDIGGKLFVVCNMHYTVNHMVSIQLDPKKVQILMKESFAAVMPSTKGRNSMLKLAERMAKGYEMIVIQLLA